MARPPTVSSASLTLLLQSQGVTTAQALADGLRVERSTVSRNLAQLGARVLRLGAARQARYALRRAVRQSGDNWPLYRIDEAGRAHELGRLLAIHGGFVLQPAARAPTWFDHGYDEGIFPGLPFFLSDARPQGFMGRAAARIVSPALGVPVDPRNWLDDDVLVYLLAQGDDLPGDCVLGERMLERALQRQASAGAGRTILENERVERYAILADEAMRDGSVGSSAGGEQAKFTASIAEHGGSTRQVLVKFSPPVDTPTGRRWADLLTAEWHALRVLEAHGHESARAELIHGGRRCFLEVARFDRPGAGGRRGLLTLAAIEAGLLDESMADWPAASRAMVNAGLLNAPDAAALRQRWCFGQLTGNTDMHFGNASVWFGHTVPFRLAPAYDMLPMVWAPGAQGELVPREFAPVPPLPGMRPDWNVVAPWAEEFWRRIRQEDRTSAEFKGLTERAGAAVARARQLFT